MFDPSEPQIVPYAFGLEILTELVDTGNALDALKLGLFQNDIVPDNLTTLALLTPADFDGYTIFSPVVWGTPYYDLDGVPLVVGGDKTWVATGGTTPNTIYGWYLTNTGGTKLVKASRFAASVGIAAAGQGMTVVPWFRYSGQ